MKTTRIKNEEIRHEWYIVDADNAVLGRLATKVATVLMGKNKVTYSPDMDNGDGVIIVNASKIKVSGNKIEDKKYYSHSGYIGSTKEKNLEEMLEKKPELVIMNAVKRMLPKNKLGRNMLTRLKVYNTNEHPHTAQQPKELKI